MANATSKAQLLAELRAEQDAFEALLREIGEEHMTQPAVADWSVKDVVAHLTGWRKRTVARLEAAGRGQEAPPPPWPAHLETDDEINAWIYETNRALPLDEILRDSRETFDQLVAALDALPEAAALDPVRFGWPEDQEVNGAVFFGHFHEEHEADLRAWLERVQREQATGTGGVA
jgi:hypothetical protein